MNAKATSASKSRETKEKSNRTLLENESLAIDAHFNLRDIIDIEEIQSIMDNYYDITQIGMALLDLEGNILVSQGWQDICTQFHRLHPVTSQNCVESDLTLSAGLEPGEFRLYRCKNNMWDMATPLFVGGQKVGNIYLGQFFFDDDVIDVELFRQQAETYGFDVKSYLQALEKVPRWDRDTVNSAMRFFEKLARYISTSGYQHLKLNAMLKEKERLLKDLSAGELKYRDLVENLNDVVFTLSMDGIVTYVSPVVEKVLGYREEALLGTNFKPLVHPDDVKALYASFEATLEGHLEPSEFRILTADRGYRWVRTSSRPAFKEGRQVGIQGTLTDIDEHMEIKGRLHQSLLWYKEIFNGSRDAIFISDENSMFIHVNAAACALTGYDENELLTMQIPDLHEEMDLDAYQRYHGHIMAGHPIVSEAKILKKDRSKVDAEFSNKRFIIGGQRYMHTTARDVSEIKKANDELHRLYERFKLATDAGKIGIWELDLETDLLIWDHWMHRLYGVPEDQFTGRYDDWKNRVHPEDFPNAEKAFLEAMNDGRPFDTRFRIVRPDGEIRHIKAKARSYRKDDGALIRMIGVNWDITEQRRYEERIQQAQKMESIGSLAGGIAHDFNNLLFPILGISEMMMEEHPEESTVYQSIHEIYKAGMRGKELVDQILTFCRQTKDQEIPVHFQKVLKEVMKLCRSTIPTDIEIEETIQADCRCVMANPTQLHQIAMNLITNAYHAVQQSGGRISVALYEATPETIASEEEHVEDIRFQRDRYVILKVTDTGVGIDPGIMNKIFDPYFTTKERGKGTGLGLSVVHGIIKKYGGHIRVKSEKGKGTTFSLFIPAMETDCRQGGQREALECPLGHESILVIDDDAPVGRIGKIMLESLGYEVTLCTGSVTALEKFKESPDRFDLIVSDMAMPEMDGIRLANEMVAVRRDIPIILCTGFSEKINPAELKKSGIRGVLTKPVRKSELAHRVRQVLDQN